MRTYLGRWWEEQGGEENLCVRHIPVAESIEIYNKLDDCGGELEGGIKDDSIISTLGG